MMKALVAIVLLGIFAQSDAIPRSLKLYPIRIVGGEPANPGELPFQISLQYNGQHICGGSVLSSRVIITAAHCSDLGIGSYQVVAGEHDMSSSDGNEQRSPVNRIQIHEQYDENTIANDIALMWLTNPFTLNQRVQPIPLPAPRHDATGDVVVSGWGSTREGGPSASILQKVTVPIITDEVCRQAYGSDVLDHMICAGIPAGGKDSCQGDSGGPMTASDLGLRYLAGLVSWGYGCARPGFPGVYTEVSHFTEWINGWRNIHAF